MPFPPAASEPQASDLQPVNTAFEMRLGLQAVGVDQSGEEHSHVEHGGCFTVSRIEEVAF